jgi:pilus assembly protein CpaE
MADKSPLLAIVGSQAEIEIVSSIVSALGYQEAEIVEGSPEDAAVRLRHDRYNPKYIVLFIGHAGSEIFSGLDDLAECCEPNTRVVVVGVANDISFYRALKDRGVVEYFNYPAPVEQICAALVHRGVETETLGKVLALYGGSSGDGSSTVALNLAYILAKVHGKKVVLVDLDYQFGMVSRQLELNASYGIKEIFDHPDRGVDATLVERMVVHYRDGMDVVTAPHALHFLPQVKPDLMREFINHLSSQYDYVVLDVPHLWNHWISATLSTSHHIIMVAQLLLKSITHSSRLLGIWSELGFSGKPIPKDFERICGRAIDFYLPNDIKTICQSENRGTPVYDMGKSQLTNEFERIAKYLIETYEKAGKR